ncbi:hypothetical protein EHQ58_12395 [Leptospira ognonensis]|uniref:Uncharacterized protein n=1 Tax=Leptospira ognonensis TaxID=2484945 RepID=A0A4V3JR18_9LEPT|nr:hypothetical protein [Leptospira ognonensis]TGL58173.1 hypothetical protein EHQ58_12395 [Leptospira ognonensis]
MEPLDIKCWKQMSPESAKRTLLSVSQSEVAREFFEILFYTPELREYFVRYLWIFREDSHVESIFKNPNLPVELVENYIYFALGQYLIDVNEEYGRYISQVTKLFPSEMSLQLLASEVVNKDKTLKIHLLANLDAKAWDTFFANLEDSSNGFGELALLFEHLEREELSRLFFRNQNLYASIRMIFVFLKESNLIKPELLSLIESLLSQIGRWEEFVKDMKSTFQLQEEKKCSPKDRNPNRLSIILHELIKISAEERMLILDFFYLNELLFDQSEIKTIDYILSVYSKEEVAQL